MVLLVQGLVAIGGLGHVHYADLSGITPQHIPYLLYFVLKNLLLQDFPTC